MQKQKIFSYISIVRNKKMSTAINFIKSTIRNNLNIKYNLDLKPYKSDHFIFLM